jgi:hypothetical protein
MKIKNRRVILRQVNVTIWGTMFRQILVTPAQLAKLNRVPVGEELFLSSYYCYAGGGFCAIRNDSGLQYISDPYRGEPRDADLLNGLL